jgi:AraC-like DNA-binding protein
MSVVLARPVLAALDRIGIDAQPVLRAANVSPAALDAIENRLPAENVRALWEHAAAAAHDRSFGVHVAQAVPPGTIDVIEYIFATSQNLGDGLTRLTKYNRLVHDPSTTELVVEPLAARYIRHGALATPQFDEFAITLLFVRSRQACRVDWTPDALRLEHHDPNPELGSVFGCPVSFGHHETELVFARGLLDLPFERSDSRLLAILERYASAVLDALPQQGSLVARVTHAIARELAHTLPTLASTARVLAMSERTLQRRLAEQGVTHSTIVDNVRRELALKHIGDASLSITEIGFMLHFSDTTAFYRAFKRWTGKSPRRYRQQLLFGPAA